MRRNSPSTERGECGREHGLAVGGPPQRAAELVRRGGLHQVALRAGGDRVEQVALGFGDGEHDDPGLLAAGPGHLDAAPVGHVQVAHHQIGLRPGDDRHGLVGIAGLAHDVEELAEVRADARSPDGVVVGQHDPHLPRDVGARRLSDELIVRPIVRPVIRPVVLVVGAHGTHSRTSVPRPGRPSTSTRPPTSSIRPLIDRLMPMPSGVAESSKPRPSSFTEQNTPPSSGCST